MLTPGERTLVRRLTIAHEAAQDAAARDKRARDAEYYRLNAGGASLREISRAAGVNVAVVQRGVIAHTIAQDKEHQ